LLVHGPGRLRVYGTTDWRERLRRDGIEAQGKLSWSADGRWLLLLGGQRVWRFDSHDWTRALPPIEIHARSLATSPDGRWLATYSEARFSRGVGLHHPSMTRIWDLASGEPKAWVSHEDVDVKMPMLSAYGRAADASGEWTHARS